MSCSTSPCRLRATPADVATLEWTDSPVRRHSRWDNQSAIWFPEQQDQVGAPNSAIMHLARARRRSQSAQSAFEDLLHPTGHPLDVERRAAVDLPRVCSTHASNWAVGRASGRGIWPV